MIDPRVADLPRLYRDRFSREEQPARDRIWRVLCDDFFARFISPDDTVLDLACGYGEFINHIRCGERLAIDLNPECGEYLRPEVTFFHRSCEDLSCIANGSLDVAFESNTFEHLPSKAVLRNVILQIREKLRPGGRLIVMQPNIRYVGPAYWDFYDHMIPLSHVSCEELFRNCGLIIEKVIPRFMPYTTKSRLPQHPLLVRAYVRFPLLWRLLGKQFVIVAQRPGET